ncbi:MAG: protein kinase [Anaerolineae bacterium]
MGTVDTGDSTSSSSDDGSSVGELSGKTVRGYYLRELLGSGGFAAVYKAYQEFQKSVGRDVAVKIILPRYANDADFIRRFEYEAQIVARLEHPFIVPLFDYWREPDAAYLVMRWLQGGSLANELRKGRLEPLRVARYLEQLAPALDYAHKHHIIHRDLKPGNLLLDRDDNVYLADFGIAKDTVNHSGVTEVGLVVGSPSYFAPEQIDGQEVGASADIYSMGIVLYELLTGYLPFTSGSITELIYKHVHEPLPPLRKYAPGLPERLELVLQRAAAKSPEDRYVSAVELAGAFRHALSASSTATQLTAVGETEPLILIDLGKHDIASPEESTQWVVALTPDNPYKGLRAFSENDADDFFGRQTLVDKLIRRMTEPEWGGRFLAVVGPSGSGKSSAVNAGLIPRLRSGAITRSDKWFITDMMPGGDPYEQLERALLKVAVKPPADMQARLRADASGLINLVGKILPDPNAELLLVIDQFEELFTQLADEAARASFLDLLYKSVTTSQSHLRVVITLRADFFDKPLHYPDFGELIRQRNEVVLPLNKQELHEAIVGPAERVGLVIGSELVETMIHDVGAQAGALPLLQFALTELYERRDGNVLSLSAYLQSGGVLGALARRADDIYNELNDERKEAARQLILRLVTLGEGAEDTPPPRQDEGSALLHTRQ